MSFLRSYGLSSATIVAVACLLGCGSGDGTKEFEQGKAAFGIRDFAKAEKLFEKCIKGAPQDVDRLVYLARVKLERADMQAAQEWIGKASEIAGNESDVLTLRAQIAWHRKDYDAALRDFLLLANDETLDSEIQAEGWVGAGIVEMTQDNRHSARIDFLRALRIDRHCASAWYHLGQLYHESFNYLEAALEQYEIYVRLGDANDSRVQTIQRVQIPALKDAIAQALAKRPGVERRNTVACENLIAKAEAASKKKNYKEAKQRYQEALMKDVLSYKAALGLAKVLQKADTSKAGQLKALEFYRTACLLRPSAVSTLLAAGDLASRLGYHSQAADIYSRAIAVSPTSLESLDGIIRSLRKSGNKTSLIQSYQQYRDILQSRKRK